MSFPKLDLDNLFTYHPVHGDQPERYKYMRGLAKDLATAVQDLVPPSPEQTMAIRKIQEAIMWANAGIACNEKPTEE